MKINRNNENHQKFYKRRGRSLLFQSNFFWEKKQNEKENSLKLKLFYLFIFHFIAEKIEKISYSLKERFCSTEKEKRISKRQFGSRIFTPGILLGLSSIFIIPIISGTLSAISIQAAIFMPMIISIVLYYGIMLMLVPTLITKRCHDFNKSGVITRRIFIGAMITFMVTSSLLVLSIFLEELSFLSNLIPSILILSNASKITLIALFLYLLFRPGTKGTNDYGDDTTNVKIGLMG